MEVEQYWPSPFWLRSRGREATNFDIWTRGGPTLNRNVFSLSYCKELPAAGDQRTAHARCFDRLIVDLLAIQDVFIVKGDIVGTQSILDRLMQGIWGLRVMLN
jgi:hypothetical protein